MHIIGLTGGIACGKSWVAECFRRLRVPVFDADACVHRLLGPGGAAVDRVAAVFPGVGIQDSGFRIQEKAPDPRILNPDALPAIDRAALGRIVFADPGRLRQLEAILHPMVAAERDAFIRLYRKRGASLIVLDIPLLFETDAHLLCDTVLVTVAPKFIQLQRATRRGLHNRKTLARIMEQQGDWRKKARAADAIIHNGLSKAYTQRQVQRLVQRLYSEGKEDYTEDSIHEATP